MSTNVLTFLQWENTVIGAISQPLTGTGGSVEEV